ncbi:PREDICTED: uncharacterized protein LOC105368704, partial [Ceratosolen solmsi marchali]|uniref:Uncharacterized protein LOC105368704 n=1 Tax=Ceratosolen solmsi marchali TaxID=326594 RepID=A0AAJ6YX84_9HYME
LASIVRQQSISADLETLSITDCSAKKALNEENYLSQSNMTVSTPITVHTSPTIAYSNVSRLARDPSFQSDSSHCSSVESLLELRRADPEAVLLSLGFGGCASSPRDTGPLSRIPKRFLQPSKLKGIAINDFVKHQQETNESLDSTSLGYRGLTGSPYVAPSEIVQKIMQRLREHEYHELDAYTTYNNNTVPHMLQQQENKLSVLSPDNRQFLDRPRSKSPDMRNKRMIIGQKSFAFGHNGDLIEVSSSRSQMSTQTNSLFKLLDDTTAPDQMGPTFIADEESMTNNNNEFSSGKSKPTLVDLDNYSGENKDSIETVVFTAEDNINANNNKITDPLEVELLSSGNSGNSDNIDELVYLSDSNQRRASEGSCKIFHSEYEKGRRFSDGLTRPMKKNESTSETSSCPSSSLARRKSLKRQAKIDVESSFEDVMSVDIDTDGSQRSGSLHLRLQNKCVHCGKVESDEKDDEEEAGLSCCYKRTSQDCWLEMEKVLQKNKKLEDVVAKSRREMAEIRDMLSSVLSVRMEPGF